MIFLTKLLAVVAGLISSAILLSDSFGTLGGQMSHNLKALGKIVIFAFCVLLLLKFIALLTNKFFNSYNLTIGDYGNYFFIPFIVTFVASLLIVVIFLKIIKINK